MGHGVPLVARGVAHGDGGEMACDNLAEVRSFVGGVHSIHSIRSIRSCQRMEGEDRSWVGCWAA